MQVALISEHGIRLYEVAVLVPEIYLPIKARVSVQYATGTGPRYTHEYRRFVRMDDHTYVEKD